MNGILDITLIIVTAILVLAGIVGCFVKVIPGPPLSFLGLIAFYFVSYVNVEPLWLLILGIEMLVVSAIAYFVPKLATKKIGVSKLAGRCCAIGVLIVAFWDITNWIIAFTIPIISTLIGEVIDIKTDKNPLKGNFLKMLRFTAGSYLNMMFGIILKLEYSCFMLYFVVKEYIIGMHEFTSTFQGQIY